MKPTQKAPGINRLADDPAPYGRVASIEADTCVWCGELAGEFKDKLSQKEYTISGYCQSCQDKIWKTS